MRYVALLVVVAGCDKLFDIDRLPDPAHGGDGGSGGSDAVIGDGATPDMPVCDATEHDDDGDLIPDRCDACPTYPDTGVGDMDNDGLPTECDRNDSPTDKDLIEAYWTFPTPADLAEFTYTGTTAGHTTDERGMAQIRAGSTMTTMVSVTPTRVELHVFGMITQDFNSNLSIRVGSTTLCTVSGTQCDGSTAGLCVATAPSNSQSLSILSGALRRISLFRTGAASISCEISSGITSTKSSNQSLAIGAGQVTIEMSANASTQLQALVIYGAK